MVLFPCNSSDRGAWSISIYIFHCRARPLAVILEVHKEILEFTDIMQEFEIVAVAYRMGGDPERFV